MTAAKPYNQQAEQTPPVAQPNPRVTAQFDIPREMGNIKDNHIARLSAWAAKAWPIQGQLRPEERQRFLNSFGPTLPILVHQGTIRSTQSHAGTRSCPNRITLRETHPTPVDHATTNVPLANGRDNIPGMPEIPPPTPAKVPPSAAGPSREFQSHSPHDAAAELLRPLIMKWVGEQMPKILEVALDSEQQTTNR